jgi:hypothetical protein
MGGGGSTGSRGTRRMGTRTRVSCSLFSNFLPGSGVSDVFSGHFLPLGVVECYTVSVMYVLHFACFSRKVRLMYV